MPRIVEFGAGKARPCALCHLPNGAGEPQSAPLAGLSAAYLIEQITAFRSGTRSGRVMCIEASNISDPDMLAAAAYYAALPMPPGRVHVIERGRVPSMHTAYWMLIPTPQTGAQALANRLIETPGNVRQIKLRNARSGYVACVSAGSITRGSALAAGQPGDRPRCALRDGVGLRGGANARAPVLAGRSPTYLTCQLVQFELGSRHGPEIETMRRAVAPLTPNDMICVAAYAASLTP